MRITGGKWRSRRLSGPSRNMPLRPTPDSMRERAFQILGPQVSGSAFIDLFAGTGAVGLEALSRGATRAVFVEKHPAASKLLRGNIALFQEAQDLASVMRLEAGSAIRRLARSRESFDIAWADPPFPTWQEGARVLAEAFALGVIRSGGTACLECPDRAGLDELPDGFSIDRDLGGGASRLLILRWS